MDGLLKTMNVSAKKKIAPAGTNNDEKGDELSEMAKIQSMMNRLGEIQQERAGANAPEEKLTLNMPTLLPQKKNKDHKASSSTKPSKFESVDATLDAQQALRNLRTTTTNLFDTENKEVLLDENGNPMESSGKARSRWLKIKMGVKVASTFKGDLAEQEKRADRIKMAELERDIMKKDEELFNARLELKEKIAFFDKERMATHTLVSNAVERYREAELQAKQTRDLLKQSIRDHEQMQEEYELLEKQKAALEAKVKMYFDVMEQQKLKIRELSVAVDPLTEKIEEMEREATKMENRIKEDMEEPKDVSKLDRILSKNVPTPELSCKCAMTGTSVMRSSMRAGISSRVLEFVMLRKG
ncbi:unnamed protein product [Amoebophrya sp. A120]|nr:unnamed protein product [Amoebophrya sp. A120]|eukprot:GSA120T00013967001.1